MAFINKPTPFEIAGGDAGTMRPVFVYGENVDVNTAIPEDVFYTTVAPAAYTLLTVAAVHALVSSSAADTAAGTGARTVLVTGLNSSYNEITETVTLNGVTPVNTVNSYIFVSSLRVVTVGSGGANAGIITATSGTIKAAIRVGENKSSLGAYLIPAGYSAFLFQWNGSIKNLNGSARLELWQKPFNEAMYIQTKMDLGKDGTSNTLRDYDGYLKFTEKTFIKVRCVADANATRVNTELILILQQN